MPSFQPLSPAQLLAPLKGSPGNNARGPRVGEIDEAWIQRDIDDRGQSSIAFQAYRKMKKVITDSGKNWQNLETDEIANAENAMCWITIYELYKHDFALRRLSGLLNESAESFEQTLSVAKTQICSAMSTGGFNCQEYCFTGILTSSVLTANDFN